MRYKSLGVTGHTSGIGKNIFENIDLETKGFSRSNGYNIDLENDRQRIVRELETFDVFVNNAKGEGMSQVRLLMQIFESWKNQKKIIINIGSLAARMCSFRGRPHLYSIEKAALHNAVQQIQMCRSTCRVTEILFGMVDTPANTGHPEKSEFLLDVNIAHKSVKQILAVNEYIPSIEVWPDSWGTT